MDYLCGYNIFPLNEASVPPKWLPLSKTYENLKRDANYYGLLGLEAECTKWFKRHTEPEDRQAVFHLDFAPFTGKGEGPLSLMSEMILECHLADVPLLRKRYIKTGAKNMTYGPISWKNIFDQIRDASDRDGVLQHDGSAYIDVASTFIKPPRQVDDDCDDRKIEYAKIHVSRDITQLIKNTTRLRPMGMSSYLTMRIHATNLTTHLTFGAQCSFPTPFQSDRNYFGEGSFVFNNKLQREGYMILRAVAFADVPHATPSKEDEGKFPLNRDDKTVLEIDGKEIDWKLLCDWIDVSRIMSSQPGTAMETLRMNKPDIPSDLEFSFCERLFVRGHRPEQKSRTV